MQISRAPRHGVSRRLGVVAVALLLLVGATPTPTVIAAGGVVSTCDESHLRSAMAGGGTVTFACSGTVSLSAMINVALPTVLDATGQKVVIDGGGKVALFGAYSVPFGVVNLTLQNGYTDLTGGAIASGSVVTATGSTFVNNRTSGGDGGAINADEVVVTNSTFVGNRGGLGGAILAIDSVTISSSTFVSNDGSGAAFSLDRGTATVKDSIFADGSFEECTRYNYGGTATIADLGGNFSIDGSCGFTQVSSHNGVVKATLHLGQLADNGGPTQTVALGAGSVAIDAGVGCPPPATDQRGSARPVGRACDSGAYESNLSRSVAVILIQGMGSAGPSTSANPGTFWQSGGVAKSLEKSVVLQQFSYNAKSAYFGGKYDECDSLQSIGASEALLDKELKAFAATNPNVDVYLVGHSQGGVVALGYLAWLTKNGRLAAGDKGYVEPFPGMRLAGIVTLDSPLGGIDLTGLAVAATAAQSLVLKPGPVTPDAIRSLIEGYLWTKCPSFDPRGTAADLADLLSLGSQGWPHRGWPWGGTGSIPKLLGTTGPKDNQELATAAAKAGVRVLTIGNFRDLLMASSGLSSTQWLTDVDDSGVFARAIDVADCALLDLACQLGHGAVLKDASVNDAIYRFIRGSAPGLDVPTSPLDAVVAATWDAAGGALSAANGLIRLTAPSGAVASPGAVSLTSVPAASIPDQVPSGQAIAGPAVSVTMPPLVAGASATLTLPVDLSVLGLTATAAIFRDGEWIRMPTKIDLRTGTAAATITEGGVYAPLTVPLAKVLLSDAIGTGIRRGSTGFTTGTVTVPVGGWVTYKVTTKPKLAGKSLVIWSRVGTGTWRTVTTRTVASDGTARFYAKVRSRTTFRATWLGDSTTSAAASPGRTAGTR